MSEATQTDATLGWWDTLVKVVLIPAIHQHFGGHVPKQVLNAAQALLLERLQAGQGGRTHATGKQLALAALNEALRAVDEARQ